MHIKGQQVVISVWGGWGGGSGNGSHFGLCGLCLFFLPIMLCSNSFQISLLCFQFSLLCFVVLPIMLTKKTLFSMFFAVSWLFSPEIHRLINSHRNSNNTLKHQHSLSSRSSVVIKNRCIKQSYSVASKLFVLIVTVLKIALLCWHYARCFGIPIMLEIMPA